MKSKKILLLISTAFVLTLPVTSMGINSGQDNTNTNEKIIIRGVVKDSNGKKLKGTAVEVLDSHSYTLSDKNGYYTIDTTPGSKIRFSYIGYNADTLTVNKSDTIDIKLYRKKDLDKATKSKNQKGKWFIGGGVGVSTGF